MRVPNDPLLGSPAHAATPSTDLLCVCRSEAVFLEAMQKLGGLDGAKPKAILQLLAPDYPELTRLVRMIVIA